MTGPTRDDAAPPGNARPPRWLLASGERGLWAEPPRQAEAGVWWVRVRGVAPVPLMFTGDERRLQAAIRLPGPAHPELLQAFAEALRGSLSRRWQMCIVVEASAILMQVALPEADLESWICLLQHVSEGLEALADPEVGVCYLRLRRPQAVPGNIPQGE